MNRSAIGIAWGVAAFFFLSTLLSGYLVFQNFILQREVKNLAERASVLGQQQATIQSFANDIIAYGQKNPDVFNITDKYGIKPPPQLQKAPPAGSNSGSKSKAN